MNVSTLPDIPMEFAEAMYNLGFILLVDDIHDVGHTTYYNRKNHFYKGKHSPDHPTPLHHWQVAIPILLLSKVLGLLAFARELLIDVVGTGFAKEERENIIEYDNYVREMNTPPLPNNELINKMPKVAIRL